MMRSLDEAVQELKRDSTQTIVAEVDGLVVEVRYKGRRSAADMFGEIGPWEGESAEDMRDLFLESRRCGGSGEPPQF